MRYLLPLLLGGLAAVRPARRQAPPPAKGKPLDTRYLRDHAETRGFMLGRPARPKPTPDGKTILFLRSKARVPKLSLYEFDVATGKTRELLTPEQVLKGAEENLTPEEKARRERQRVSVGGLTSFQLSDDGRLILVQLSGRPYVVERATGKVRELDTGKGVVTDPKFSPDAKLVAYIKDHDIYAYDLAANKEHRVTSGGTEKRTHGEAEFVAQEEMNRFTGYWWAPDAKHLAYEEADADGVEVWHVADPIHPDRPPQPFFYPRPGKANVKVRLGVISAAGGETTWVKWDAKKYPYLAFVRWEKDGPLSLAVQTRDQQELALLAADPRTGKTRPLVVEKDPAWVNLPRGVPRWLPDGKGFLWISERDGGPQLELRNPEGKLVRVLVPPAAGFDELIDVDAKTRQVVYAASTDPTQAYLFRVGLDGGMPVPLSKAPGLNSAAFGEGHDVYALTTSTPDAMPRTTVHRADGTRIGELPSVAEEPPFRPKMEIVKVGPGQGFYAAIIRSEEHTS